LIQSALGEKAVAHLADLDVVPDLVNVFRKPEAIPELADELLALPGGRRPQTVWLQTGISHPASEARLEAAGYRMVSDKCLGVLVARSGR
ncbi:MAG: CoA-binding protein, partial [bacterium]